MVCTVSVTTATCLKYQNLVGDHHGKGFPQMDIEERICMI